MARKILLKTSNSPIQTPDGYKALTVDDKSQISIIGGVDSERQYFQKDAESTSLISDAESYEFRGDKIYTSDYWGSFIYNDINFHLVQMKVVQPTHDFFDDAYVSPLYWGIFKEDGGYLRFCDAFDPVTDLSIDLNDYFENYGSVNGFSVNTVGLNYPTGTDISTTGGSGTGLTVDIFGGVVQDVDFDNVTPSNSFPIEAYANQTATFTQNSTTGSGTGCEVEVTFDSSGNISSFTITGGGGNHEVNDVIQTNDPYAGSLYYKITQTSGLENTPNISNPGTGYKSGDIVTVSGGDGNGTLIIEGANSQNYENSALWSNMRKISTGLEFVAMGFYDYSLDEYINSYIKFNVDLDSDGKVTSIYEVSSRKIGATASVGFNDLNLENITDGFTKLSYELNLSGGEINDTWWDCTKWIYGRTRSRENVFPTHLRTNTDFTQESTTGIGTGFQVNFTINEEGYLGGSTTTNPNGSNYAEGDYITLTDGATCSIIVKINSVNEDGSVNDFTYDDLSSVTDPVDFCRYDLISNEIEVLIEDFETWWGLNTDVPYSVDIDGSTYTVSFKGGIIPHPDKPLFKCVPSNVSDIFSGSYMVDPTSTIKFHKFADNKMTDYAANSVMTKNKIYIINPLMG